MVFVPLAEACCVVVGWLNWRRDFCKGRKLDGWEWETGGVVVMYDQVHAPSVNMRLVNLSGSRRGRNGLGVCQRYHPSH